MKMKNQKHKVFKARCYKFTLGVMKLIETFPNKKIYWSLGDQLFRSASSIGANIIEARAASSKRDYINFYQTALKSANEVKYWLSLVRDSGIGDQKLVIELLKEAEELSNIIGASVLTLKGKR